MFNSGILGFWIYLIPLLIVWGLYIGLKASKKRVAVRARDEAVEAGLVEPASLHPVINHNRCLGCGSCVEACPEHPGHQVLGLIDGKSHLINPTDCIGHGACQKACPADAITLVFGTERRGVEIPVVTPSFETDVPGVYIAGELGGMGLVRNAITQGTEAMESIKGVDGIGTGEMLDVLVVGAGPAGFAASLYALENKLRCVTVEQDSLGGTVYNFPRQKIVMTAPVDLPMYGSVKFTETTKEKLLEFWQKVERDTGVKIKYKERVESIVRKGEGLEVKTTRGNYLTRTVLLAIGRRGTPRKLGAAGEELPKVVYRLIDPEQYRAHKVLVVGGGDSALEAAISISEEPGTSVTISYRGGAFSRAKEKNRRKVKEAEKAGRLKVYFNSNVKSINETSVEIDESGTRVDIDNDDVIVNAGGILPTAFLKDVGINVETRYGTR
ncbi:MAG: NAD(P)-binding domain-containing protein [Proteobacteria bacterium]|nr:NAD(P)-binding domain-containing protein [Pseudomonadota bacterium]